MSNGVDSLPVLSIGEWLDIYQSSPSQLANIYTQFLSLARQDDNAWITLASREQIDAQLAPLLRAVSEGGREPREFPLFGVPFAVKDNIDVAGFPTSAACPEFLYHPREDAAVVARLKAAGAIVVGKTNLDQFATGLVGTRSPYGAVTNTFDKRYVSGGSSSGSASVVARGLTLFSLGTDTAGSGRVPAGFNNIVGLKPTRGWLSNRGLVPSCQFLACIAVFALQVEDARRVADIAGGYDPDDPWSRQDPYCAPARLSERPRFAIPDKLTFCGDSQSEQAFNQALAQMSALGVTLEPVDFTPFRELAEQLYAGPWVAERTLAVRGLLEKNPLALDPTVRTIVKQGYRYSACDAWLAGYQRAQLSRDIHHALAGFDALLVPTSPTIRTLEEMAQEPVRYNAEFGTYTNFTNLADLCALALPSTFREDGLPAGITLIAPAWHDAALAHFGQRWQQALALPVGATGHALATLPEAALSSTGHVRLAVVGAHLRGMPLNHQLTGRDAVFIEQTTTAPDYRLYALANTTPPKPGLVRAPGGNAIEVELWDVPLARFGEFVAEVPAPLGIGSLQLADGRQVKGFICEPLGLEGATNISAWGGWRAWLARDSHNGQ